MRVSPNEREVCFLFAVMTRRSNILFDLIRVCVCVCADILRHFIELRRELKRYFYFILLRSIQYRKV